MARRSTPPQRRSDSPLHGHCDVAFYNEVRPHSAIGNKVPAALHRATGTVHRFWEGDGDEGGQLEQRRGNRYAFLFRTASEHDETINRLCDHVFRAFEHLSVREHDGGILTFCIVAARLAPG